MKDNPTNTSQVVLRFYQYFQERFPIVPAMLFAVLFASAGTLYADQLSLLTTLAIFTLTIFLFLLRVRLVDEFKDYHFDMEHYSDRPVPRGLVSLREIKVLLIGVIALELLLQSFFGITALLFYALLLFYHFLMYKDFFSESLEKKYFSSYIFLHQTIFLFYGYYILLVARNTFPTHADIGILLALFLPGYIYEIGRKCQYRLSDQGCNNTDTYIYKWGEMKSFSFLYFLLLLQPLSLFLIFGTFNFLILINLLLMLLLLIVFIFNKVATLQLADKWSVALGILGMILLNIGLIWL